MPITLPPAGTFANPALKEGEFKTALETQLAALAEAQVELGAADMATLQGQVTTLQGQVTTLQADVATLTARATAAENIARYARGSARLTFANGTTLRIGPGLIPLKVGGVWKMANVYADIPSPGLAASTLFYVYAYDQAGVVKFEFSTTGHALDGASDSVWVEIKTDDPTRTLLGMVATVAGGQFQSDLLLRGVLSWYNRRALVAEFSSAGPVTHNNPAAWASVGAATLLSWGAQESPISITASAIVSPSQAGPGLYVGVGVNSPSGPNSQAYVRYFNAIGASQAVAPVVTLVDRMATTEGGHAIYFLKYTNGGVSTYTDMILQATVIG
jgi:hypothetical protein